VLNFFEQYERQLWIFFKAAAIVLAHHGACSGRLDADILAAKANI
jgi:hypothetical protein